MAVFRPEISRLPMSKNRPSNLFFSIEGDVESLESKIEGQAYRNRLNEIVEDPDKDASEKIQSILKLGTEWLGVENGHLTEIDPAAGTHTIAQTSGEHRAITVGTTTDLSGTYCRKVIAQNSGMAVTDAVGQGFGDDPAYQVYGFSTYLGEKVVVGGELYGTACFVGREPKEEEISEPKAAALALLARSVEEVLEWHQREDRRSETKGWPKVAYEESPAMIVMLGGSGTLIAPNARLQEKTGQEAETLAKMKVWDLDQEVSRKETRAFWNEMRHGDRRQWEGRFRRKDGTTFPVDVELRCLDLEGERRFVFIGRDITGRRKQERRYEAVFNRTYQLNGLMEPDGTVVEVNDRALQFGGLSREEVVGKPLWETYWSQTGQKSKRKLKAAIQRASKGNFVRHEREIQGKEETRIVDFSILPITDEEGEVSILVAEARDITERKEVEEKLRRSEGLHREVLRNVTDAVLITREDGTFSYICPNVEHIFGYDVGEVEKLGSISALLGTDPAGNRDLAEGEEISNAEQSIVDASGNRHDLLVNVRGVSIQEGRRMYTCRDITGRKETEQELARRSELFAKAQDMADVGGWEYYVQSGEHTWTEEVYRIYGVPLSFNPTVEEGVAYYHPEDRPTIREAFTRAVEDGEPYDVELRLIAGSGEQKWVRTRGDPQRGEDGEVVRVQGTIQDITERKEREQELRSRQARLKALYEDSPDMIDLHDAQGRIMDPNARLLKKTGFTKEELTDMHIWELDETVTEEEAQDLWESMAPGDRRRLEGRYRRTDGSTFPVEVHLRRLDLEDEDRFMAISHDITEQKRREENLKRRRQNIEALYEATRELLRAGSQEAVYDRIHGVLRKVFDYDLVNTGQLDEETIRPVRTDRAGAEIPSTRPRPAQGHSIAAQALRAGDTVVVKDTDRLENDVDYGDLRSAAGMPIGEHGVVIVGRVGEKTFDRFNLRLIEVLAGYASLVLEGLEREERLRGAKEEAEKAARLKSAMLANMSHEIRTPLTSIIGFAEMIGEETSRLTERFEAPELDSLSEFAELIEQSGHRLLETLNGVLNLSKLEAGEMSLSEEKVDLAAGAEDVAEEFTLRAEEAGIYLQVEPGVAPVWARADEKGLQIALRNLVSNAIKYTEEGGQVLVRVRQEEEAAVFEIEDTGIGMDPGQVEELFEPFRQASEGFGREYEGSGLGLAVTKRAVEKMGGSTAVDTEKGKGTCFTIRLPLAEEGRRNGEGAGDEDSEE